jgi:uncharacterized protein (TIGR03435 family)
MRKFLPFLAALAAILLFSQLQAQPRQTSARPDTPQWQIAAGGKMSFDVASVKRHAYDPAASYYIPHHNFPLDDGPDYANTGGLLSAENMTVLTYIVFSYKLDSDQAAHLVYPKWFVNEHYDIEARGPANATKDQMRLMMQSLLAERFKLAVHWEAQELPVFHLVFVKPGQPGAQLKLAAHGCESLSGSPTQPPVPGQAPCGEGRMLYLPDGTSQIFGRNQTMQQISQTMGHWPGTGIERPIADGTSASGKFDFRMTWAPEPTPGVVAPMPAPSSAPSFLDALRDQLGLKLVSATATMPFLILDHIEEPTPN